MDLGVVMDTKESLESLLPISRKDLSKKILKILREEELDSNV